jgi:membrane protease YdiL (CAAX protease family)
MNKTVKFKAWFLPLMLVALFNYSLAELLQPITGRLLSIADFSITLAIPWILIACLLIATGAKDSGLRLQTDQIKKNRTKLSVYLLLIVIGLILFAITGITKTFNTVRFPILFFIFIPLVEEMIFRGYIYGKLQQITKHVVLISSILFAIHHIQYYDYSIGLFAMFQVAYTFVLGLLFGKLREYSGSIYLGIIIHIIINYLSYKI